MDTFVIAFESTHEALSAQDSLTRVRERFLLIPTPQDISAGCGMALRFEAVDGAAAAQVFTVAVGTRADGAVLYRQEGGSYLRVL